MNDTFSFSRFGLLAKKFTKEHIGTYLLYLAALGGILTIILGLVVLVNMGGHHFPQEVPEILYIFGLLIGGSMFAGSFYSFFQNKARGIQYLNLPASHSEKLLLGYVYIQIVFFISFIIMFFLIDRMMIGIFNKFHTIPADATPDRYAGYTAQPMAILGPETTVGLIISIVASAIAHYGSLCFEKNAFVKTALIVMVIFTAILYCNYQFAANMLPEENMPGGMFFTKSLRLGTDHQETKGIVLLPDSWYNFVCWFLPGIVYAFFWTASYFKLREKQV
ncbi:MAG: hypothetical protein V4557_07310 [Bacteroidota bacterium]